jgi:hypothetical protein
MNHKSFSSWKQSIKARNEAARARGERLRQIDRSFDRPVGKISRFLWPLREEWLLLVVGTLFLLDYISTYLALQHVGISEEGPLAAWALDVGGFAFLLLIDFVAAVVFALLALLARFLYRRAGLPGYARAAFVILLVPYIVRTAVVVINNFILGFR